MKYAPINKQLFIENRGRFAKHLKPKSLAVFNSNDIMPKSADGTMRFVQNTDIFYLSGVDQEESILLICPEAHEAKHREVLFVRETNEHIAVWEGEKLTKEQATAVSGVQTVYWLSEFNKIFMGLAFESEYIYLATNEHLRNSSEVETRDDRFRKWCMQTYPLHKYERSAPIMHHLRAVKSKIEIELLQTACNIVEKAFRRVLGFIKPGVMEYEIEAEILHEYVRNRSRGVAYEAIIASGANACVLHYIENKNMCKDGELILLDIGCEYANYNSDLTRTIPVNGKFTKRQRQVYEAVLRVQRHALGLLVPGNNLNDYTKEIEQVMEGELIGLGLFSKDDVKKQDPNKPLYKKYFMHGVSHHLGLDVHDYGIRQRSFEEGMVFTCEPGIYIREEGIGIRLENDVVVTKGKPFDLMANIPIEIADIEALMKK